MKFGEENSTEKEMENRNIVEGQIVLSGYEEIFRYILEFENKLHERHCIQVLEHTECAKEQRPKLHVELLKKESGCLCSENLLEKVKDILNDVPESKLIDIFEYHIKRYIIRQNPQYKTIVCDLVSHLQDVCIEKRFTELKRTLLVKDLSGYKEIFQNFIDFENGLHKTNCITFLPLNVKGQMPYMPKLRLTLITKQVICSCSWYFLRIVKDISDDSPESELVDSFKDSRVVQKYISETHYNEDFLRWVSHLQDICIEKGFENLRRALQVTDLYDYKEVFRYFVDFENGLHKMNCIAIFPARVVASECGKMPKLRLKLLDKKGDCKCSENFLLKVELPLKYLQESELVQLFKDYLQGYVRNKNNDDKDIACMLVSHLQNLCISERLSELARCCFQTNMTTEKLMKIFTMRFNELSDKITAAIISEMDCESVYKTISSPDFHQRMKIIVRERSETLTKLMEKCVQQIGKSYYANYGTFGIFERDDACLTPDKNRFDFFNYTVYQQIAYRGMMDAVCSRAYRALTKAKWEDWCRRVFVIDAVMYLTSIVFLTFVAVLSVNAPNVAAYQSPLDYTRAIFEILLLLNAARILGIEIYQISRLKKEYFVDKMNIVEITSPVLLLLLLPMRYIHEQTHWYIYAVTYLVWFLQIIKYAPVFKFTGVFVDSLQKMFVKDILRFGIILSITIVVFSGTFLLVLKAENTLQLHEETTSFWKIGIVGIRIMIESDGIVEYTGDEGYKFAGAMVMMTFMFFIIVVLLNMLIAKLMNTYREIEQTSLSGFRVRRAKIVARMEREHMPFPFNIFKIDDKRKSFYSKISCGGCLKISDDLNISDTEKIHDDSLTIQQNLEDRLTEISNTLQELKKYCVSIRDSVNHSESHKHEFANLHKNDDAAEATTHL